MSTYFLVFPLSLGCSYLVCKRINRDTCVIFKKYILLVFFFQLIKFFFENPIVYIEIQLFIKLFNHKLFIKGCRIFQKVISHCNSFIIQLKNFFFSARSPFEIIFGLQISKIINYIFQLTSNNIKIWKNKY